MRKMLFIFVVGILLLIPFYVNADVVQEWGKALNLSNSISSSIIEVEDGFIVMQYEGYASADNLLKKYDFNGNKVWEKKNEYGYNISAGENSFYIWSDHKLYQLDKDGNVLLSINDRFSSSYSPYMFITIKDNIVISVYYNRYSDAYLYIYDNKGTLLERKDVYNTFGTVVAMRKDDDGNIAIFSRKGDALYFYLVDENLQILLTNCYDISGKSKEFDGYKGIVITNNKYILYGCNIVVYDKDKDEFDIIDNSVLDMKVIDDEIYSYEQREMRYAYAYGTAFVKYDSNLNKINENTLPLMYSTTMFENNKSGFVKLKNRAIFIKENEKVDVIVLNAPFKFVNGGNDVSVYYDSDEEMVYGLAKYSFVDNVDTPVDGAEDTDSTINDLVNNPETSSTGVIVFFIILIVAAIIFVVIKNNKDKIKRFE